VLSAAAAKELPRVYSRAAELLGRVEAMPPGGTQDMFAMLPCLLGGDQAAHVQIVERLEAAGPCAEGETRSNALLSAIFAYEVYRIGEPAHEEATRDVRATIGEIQAKLDGADGDEPVQELRALLGACERLRDVVGARYAVASSISPVTATFRFIRDCLARFYRDEREETRAGALAGEALEELVTKHITMLRGLRLEADALFVASAKRHALKRRRQIDMLGRRIHTCNEKVTATRESGVDVKKSKRMLAESLRQLRKIAADVGHMAHVLALITEDGELDTSDICSMVDAMLALIGMDMVPSNGHRRAGSAGV